MKRSIRGYWTLLIAVLAIVCSSIQARTLPTCEKQYRDICQRLAADPRDFLYEGPYQSFVLNPGRPASEVFQSYRMQELMRFPVVPPERGVTSEQAWSFLSRSNPENFKHAIIPLLETIKAVTIQTLEQSSSGSATRTLMLQKTRRLRVEIVNRPRCHISSRPVVAGIDLRDDMIAVCPIVTHLHPYSLVTMLSHEVGHLLDPCQLVLQLDFPASFREAPFLGLHRSIRADKGHQVAALDQSRIDLKSGVCELDEEVVADHLGAAIAEKVLATGIVVPPPGLSQDAQAAALLLIRLTPVCEEPLISTHPFLNNPGIQEKLQCTSPIGA